MCSRIFSGIQVQQPKPMFGTSAEKSAEDNEDDPEAFEATVDFKPVVPLPDKIDVVTGEENEEV